METAIRHIRFAELLPEDIKLPEIEVAVIGVGAVGRQVALQLASMGVGSMTLMDHDQVNEENLGTQGFFSDQLDMPKVLAVKDTIAQIDRRIQVTALPAWQTTYCPQLPPHVFCCVDSLNVRTEIFEHECQKCSSFMDARMRIMQMRIVTWTNQMPATWYTSTLARDSEAPQERCTLKATIFTASIAAGMCVSSWINLLRGLKVPLDVYFDLTSSMLRVLDHREVHLSEPDVPPPAAAAERSSVTPQESPAAG